MAKDGIGTIVMLGIVGVGGYWLYSSGILSSLFGTAAPVPTTPPTTNPPAGGTNPVPAAPVPAPTSGPSCSPVGALAKILALAQKGSPQLKLGPSGTDTLTIDEWDYYGNQYCTGMLDQAGVNADTLFPGDATRGGQLNWNAFAGYAAQKGLSAAPAHSRGRRVGRRIVTGPRPGGRRVGPQLIGTNPVRRIAA